MYKRRRLAVLTLGVLVVLAAVAQLVTTVRPSQSMQSMPRIEDFVVPKLTTAGYSEGRGFLTGCLPNAAGEPSVWVDSIDVDAKGFETDEFIEARFYYASPEPLILDAELLKTRPFMVWVWKFGVEDENPTVLIDFNRDGNVDLKTTFEDIKTKAVPPFTKPLTRYCEIVELVK